MASASSGRRRVVTLIAAAAVLGMVVGIVVHGLRGREESAPEASAKAEPAAAAKVETLAPTPAPVPAPPIVDEKPAPVAAAPVVAAPSKKAAPARRVAKAAPPKRVAKIEPAKPDPEPPKRVVKADPGKLYMDAKPWATIYVDGKKIGATPILGVSIGVGDHTIRAVTEDGRSKSLSVRVESGQTVRKKVTW
jgi:serine/threonine-protein kinase